jgi:hypothetical protein
VTLTGHVTARATPGAAIPTTAVVMAIQDACRISTLADAKVTPGAVILTTAVVMAIQDACRISTLADAKVTPGVGVTD